MPNDELGDWSSKWGFTAAPKAPEVSTDAINGLLNRHGSVTPTGPMVVNISHVAFEPWFTLEYGGQTEELDQLECLQWFKDHGATSEKQQAACNEAINRAFNFYSARVVIANPTKKPVTFVDPIEPKI